MRIAKAQTAVRRSFFRQPDRSDGAAALGYWQLVAAGEPSRLLFPRGTAAGTIGAMMGPLDLRKVTSIYLPSANTSVHIYIQP